MVKPLSKVSTKTSPAPASSTAPMSQTAQGLPPPSSGRDRLRWSTSRAVRGRRGVVDGRAAGQGPVDRRRPAKPPEAPTASGRRHRPGRTPPRPQLSPGLSRLPPRVIDVGARRSRPDQGVGEGGASYGCDSTASRLSTTRVQSSMRTEGRQDEDARSCRRRRCRHGDVGQDGPAAVDATATSAVATLPLTVVRSIWSPTVRTRRCSWRRCCR